MADALTPWILSYLTDIAESYGAQLSNIPMYPKKKKVQIIEFLTFGSETQHTYIWARVADKQHIIPMKFNKEAVANFSVTSNVSTRLTQHKGAIMSIQKFKPIYTRLPTSDGRKSSKESYLALECDYVSLLGSSGESTFGNPKPIITHPDMQLWSEGLDRPGGAGNVLKERKQRSAESHVDVAESSTKNSQMPPPSFAPPRPRDLTVDKTAMPLKMGKVTDLESYRARWQVVEKNTYYRHPPEKLEGTLPTTKLEQEDFLAQENPASQISLAESSFHPDDMVIDEPQPTRSRSGTPLTVWEASPRASKPSSTNESRVLSMKNTNTTASSLAPPTPAQRINRATDTPDHPPLSSFPLGNESILDLEPEVSSSQVARVRSVVSRKVPRPTSPQPRRHAAGPERVLVPNSDTSGTQSQSMTQSQSQSQSQPRVRAIEMQVGPSSSRNHAPEQVEEEAGDAAMDIDVDDGKKHRTRGISRAKSDCPSPRGVRRVPEAGGNERRFAGSEHSSRDSSGGSSRSQSVEGNGDEEGDDQRREGSEDEYPWMSLRSIRGIIVRADALRRGLPN